MAGAIVTARSDIHDQGGIASKMLRQFIDADRINCNPVETEHMFGRIAVFHIHNWCGFIEHVHMCKAHAEEP